MKARKVLLAVLFIAGLAGVGYAAGELYAGAMGTEWARDLRAKLQSARGGPGFHDPPVIGGVTYERTLEDLEGLAYKRAHIAFVCLLACGVSVVLSGAELWRVRGTSARRDLTSPRSPH